MDYDHFKNKLLDLSSNNRVLKFIANRVKLENYRGIHVSQHHRYSFDDACKILSELYNFAKMSKIKIRTVDLSKQPSDILGTEIYTEFCKKINKIFHKFTQDTIRKNIFVDFARMGFLNRYDKNGNLNKVDEKKTCQYVALSDLGKKLALKSETKKSKYIAFTKGIEALLHNLPLEIFKLCGETDMKITRMEFTYFASFLGKTIIDDQGVEKIVSLNDVVELIKEYRELSKLHKYIDELVSQYCNPKNFNKNNKVYKRDFNNWINETDQIFKLLSSTIYFDYLKKYGVLKLRVNKKMNINNIESLKRSSEEKENYFKQHKVVKNNTMSLHHIVPLSLWNELEDFKLLDDWRNMIYISNEKHYDLHKKNDEYYHVKINDNIFSLVADESNQIDYVNLIDVHYRIDKNKEMLDYNNSLVEIFLEKN